ncbi:cache domain-containing sensor histidine kinase [Cohnella cholangitidis]|uniref:HAMP domain-containing protein n=1 Tax=Cohnella cholangitidis TaxID=2598458 RepID=A0A7G5BYI0_9BACL|nr:sensor histidine kinase [Cohnella cholangitidis]QMV42014.1 HAMP domain-containing protein [Cohnella cholangitidis]
MKSHSIRQRLIKFMLIITVVPLVLSLVITLIHTRESVKEQSVNENARLIFQGKTNLVNYLGNINRASIVVYSDPHFLNNLSKSLDDYQAVAEIYTTLQNLQGSLPDIQQVYLHSRQTNQSTLITNSIPRRGYRDAPYASTLRYDTATASIEPPHPVHSYGFPPSPNDYKDRQVFTFYRPIVRIPSTAQLAIMAIDVNLDGIAAICNQLYEADDEQLYLVDKNGTVIYSGNPEEIGRPLASGDIAASATNNQSGYIDGKNAIQVYEQLEVPFAEWTLVKRIPHSVLYRASTELITINAIIAALALLAVILGTLFISFRITKPIKQLAAYMNQIQTGRLNVDIEVDSQDEIGTLSRRFRQMMDTINNLILRKYRLELANKNNQLRALQAQIDPHFLYNALQSIGTVALQNDGRRVYNLLASLSDMMRYKMRSGEAMVTLQEEIDHLKLYLDLQKERFDEQFDFALDLDPNSLSAAIPKMTLQPLIENYFKHGLEPKLGKGQLSVRSRVLPFNRLVIEVENNGTSIPETELRQLQEELSTLKDELEENGIREHSSIGLYNVLMRLQLYSADTARLFIENVEPHGVRITLEYAWEWSDPT